MGEEPQPQQNLKQDNEYVVYIDGSAVNNGNRYAGSMGAGWVIYNAQGEKIVEASMPLPHYRSECNGLVAEFLAATMALNTLPEGSNIKILTDHSAVLAILQDRHLTRSFRNPKGQRHFALRDAIRLLEAANRHNNIRAFKSKKSNPAFREAHQLAQEATTRDKAIQLAYRMEG